MDPRLKKLFYRASHRGIKEMDLILTAFARRELAGLGAAELDQFEALLEVPDQDLYFWITGGAPVPAAHATPLMERVRALQAVAGETGA
jgi:antitoxin CptB